jgi:hypothetical protein
MKSGAKSIEELVYEPETGLIHGPSGRHDAWVDQDGRARIKVGGRVYSVHRLAWRLAHGKWPDGEIDHINGDKGDNRLCNLRDVDRSTNQQNAKRAQANNKSSGLLGVSFHGSRNKFRAQITYENRRHHIGYFSTAELAHAAYLKEKRRHHAGCTI